MGTFQLTYDDFTGGHYMGNAVQKQPANTWTGSNVILGMKGDIIPVAATLAGSGGTPSVGGTYNSAQIYDNWIVGETGYVFVTFPGIGSTATASRLLKKQLDQISGTNYTSYTPTGIFVGRVAYDAELNEFFYLTDACAVRRISLTGTDTLVSSTFSSTDALTNVTISGYRLLLWGPTKKRLYYSNAARTSFSNTDYYEFESPIIGVYPRPNDILVVTEEGAYSMVGVLGSSISIQRILATGDVMDGMRDGAISGRNLIFADSSKVGLIDGRLYELGGSSVVPVASFNTPTFLSNITDADQVVRVETINDGRLCAAWANGEVYVADKNGSWSLLSATDGKVAAAGANQFVISRFAVNSHNEFFTIAWRTSSNSIKLVRYVHNFPVPCKSSYSFVYASNTASTTGASGTVELSEYWHEKPFIVKDVMAEMVLDDRNKIAVTGNVGLAASVQPLGVVDVTVPDVPTYNTASSQTYTVNNSTVGTTQVRAIVRFRVDSAPKGYGVAVTMTVNSVRLRRVIVTCED